ncbi:MAG: hypothetical protein QOE08_1853 [Thermoleophilaceae bacterium]|jgi:hypothetical protein|nr:hypothetical protein [Thermoleophilaceae bacterium]
MTAQQQSEHASDNENSPDAEASAHDRAKAQEKVDESAAEEMRELEKGEPPTDLKDWPSGPAMYLTYGNEEGELYGKGVTAKLGPANLQRFSDGSVAIDGEKVDNPDDYKGEPIAGGPTDPNAPDS